MIKYKIQIFSLLCGLSLWGCAQEKDIFPVADTTLDETKILLANPIALAVDETNQKLYVVNSNVDFFTEDSTLVSLDVDVSDLNAPQLVASQSLSIPNFAGQIYFDGTSDLVIPFRESSPDDENRDMIALYQLNDEALWVESLVKTVSDNPFGLNHKDDLIYVVSPYVLSLFNADLELQSEIDLSSAQEAGLALSDANYVESVVINDSATKALVSNRLGNIFVVDLVQKDVVQVVSGYDSTRDMLVDADDPSRVYVVDSDSEAILVFDFDLLPEPETIPETLDASEFLVASLGVGQDPNGLAMDAETHRLFVCNSFDDTLSVIDTVSLQEIARVSLNADDISADFVRDVQDPVSVTLGSFGGEKYVFVAGFTSNSIAVVRLATLEVVAVYPSNDVYFEADSRD